MNSLQSRLGRFKTNPPAAGKGVINDGCGLKKSRTKRTRAARLTQRGVSSALVNVACSFPKPGTARGEGRSQQRCAPSPAACTEGWGAASRNYDLGGEDEALQQLIWGLDTQEFW